MLDYAFEVEHFDRHLGRMLESLARRGLLENTLVVVTSDHGMPFPRGKGNAYEFSNHVPLAIRWPAGIAGRGRVVDDHVSFVDLAPTFLEVAGLTREKAGMAEFAGRSLSGIFRAGRSGQIEAARKAIGQALEDRFTFLLTQLQTQNTRDVAAKHAPFVPGSFPVFDATVAVAKGPEDVTGLSD